MRAIPVDVIDRARESSVGVEHTNTNAYRLFQRMLASGHPPDSWDHPLCQAAPNTRQLRRVAPPDDPDD